MHVQAGWNDAEAVGAGLIVLSPVLLALSRWAKHWQEDRLLEAFLEALDGCMGSIRCEHTALPVLSAHMAQQGPVLLRSFWRQLCHAMEERDAEPVRLWRQELDHVGLPEAAQRILEPFPAALRSYDTEQVLHALERMAVALEEYRNKEAGSFRRDFKTHTGLQASAALLLLILLF